MFRPAAPRGAGRAAGPAAETGPGGHRCHARPTRAPLVQGPAAPALALVEPSRVGEDGADDRRATRQAMDAHGLGVWDGIVRIVRHELRSDLNKVASRR